MLLREEMVERGGKDSSLETEHLSFPLRSTAEEKHPVKTVEVTNMEQKWLIALQAVCRQAIDRYNDSRTTVHPCHDGVLGMPGLELVRTMRNNKMLDDKDVLPAFFHPMAVAILMSLPNPWWLVRVILQVAEEPGHMPSGHIDLGAVLQAMFSFSLADDAVAIRLGLSTEKDVSQASTEELAALVDCGAVLLDYSKQPGRRHCIYTDKPTPVPNPVFYTSWAGNQLLSALH